MTFQSILDSVSRRTVLGGVASGTLLLAGCAGDDNSGTDTPDAVGTDPDDGAGTDADDGVLVRW